MKLTFFANIEPIFYQNFQKKIFGQIESFSRQGYTTSLEIEHDTSFYIYLKFLIKILNCDSKNIFIRGVGLRTILMLPIILFLRIKGKKIILEIPTAMSSVLYEYLLNKNKRFNDFIYFILNIFFGIIFLNLFNKIIGYSPEKFPFNFFLKNKFFLETNSYDVKKINFIKKKNLIKNKINFIIVGSIAPWHGIERVLKSIKNFENQNNDILINIHIVGDISLFYKKYINNFIIKNKLKSSIHFAGSLYGENLFNLYKHMHIALGSLGLKKINNRVRSELKIREYTSVGIPFIMESDDLDFKKDLNFLYKVNYGHSMIDISNVIKWYNRLDINIPLIMRDFALKNLDFANKKYSYFE